MCDVRRIVLQISILSFFAFAGASWLYEADPLDCAVRALLAAAAVFAMGLVIAGVADRIMAQAGGVVKHDRSSSDNDGPADGD